MAKVKQYKSQTGERGVSFKCPGCHGYHIVPVENSQPRPAWGFNENFDRPTLTPSILAKSGHYASGVQQDQCANCKENAAHPEEADGFECGICHSFVTDGRIQFLSDCTHALAGQTVELPEIDDATE